MGISDNRESAPRRGGGFWLLHVPGWVLLTYVSYAQGITAFNYELGVAMGTQEPAEVITEVGSAFWYGFAFADLVVYIPLLLAGLIGHWNGLAWGRALLGAALGVTIYWPIVCLAAVVAAREAEGWALVDEAQYWIALPAIALWGVWGLWWLTRSATND